MDLGDKRKKAGLMVVLIFVLGFLSGALTANLVSRASEKPPSPERRHRDSGWLMQQLTEQLHLTPEQRQAIDQILAETKDEYTRLRQETRPRFREIRTRSRDRIRAILEPEQRERFKALVQRLDEKSRQRHKHRP